MDVYCSYEDWTLVLIFFVSQLVFYDTSKNLKL